MHQSNLRGFKNFDAAHRFCRAFDEVRNFLRRTNYISQNVSLARRRVLHVERVAALHLPRKLTEPSGSTASPLPG